MYLIQKKEFQRKLPVLKWLICQEIHEVNLLLNLINTYMGCSLPTPAFCGLLKYMQMDILHIYFDTQAMNTHFGFLFSPNAFTRIKPIFILCSFKCNGIIFFLIQNLWAIFIVGIYQCCKTLVQLNFETRISIFFILDSVLRNIFIRGLFLNMNVI